MKEFPVSSEQVRWFLTSSVAPAASRLRSAASYMQSAGTETLDALDKGRLPAWVFSHQAVQDMYQAEGALIALRHLAQSILRTEADRAAYEAMLTDSTNQHFVKVATTHPIDAQVASKPDGWYVFNSDGQLLAGPFDNEQEADDVSADREGKNWVGQRTDGIVDISYAPEDIT